MKRGVVINILLIFAGIFLAFALFAAGVLWKNKATTKARTVGMVGLTGN